MSHGTVYEIKVSNPQEILNGRKCIVCKAEDVNLVSMLRNLDCGNCNKNVLDAIYLCQNCLKKLVNLLEVADD